jgi:hypothetical protein
MATDTTANDTGPATPATTAAPEDKSFLEQAQEAIGDAIESTVEAAKENPIAAAAIAAGAAAAVAGAAYGISQLLGNDDEKK